MGSDISYQEKCACAQSSFCTYVEGLENYSQVEKDYLTKIILGNNLSGILYVSSALAAWSFIVGIIDAMLFPGVIVYAIFHGVIDYKVLTPLIVFSVGNFVAKLIYIAANLKGKVKFYDIFITALPYAGSAYLLKKFFVNDQLLFKAVISYLKMKKDIVKKKIFRMFRNNR
ncbi:hypothetical protein L3049_12005 [Labilibaculum sp. DW002]|uniref:Uncharacterized protein n=1 Tax=Paralabilibaculum antarcticum TaxID=2912572 RepID=A0ABT5VTH9_9BACT|nr:MULTISPECIES: hypothetical protein [unclassified Labilibaculum]MBI9058205.1 hypothetical protein [Labilibaculum sp.]MDE5418729.1 hypothetical protein [Labilibaculum sp. DW002]